jgi:Lipoprotein LpqB beta-propeller domain/Sporulation and spore germination
VRTGRLVAALLAAAALASGCASIPSSSPPQVFPIDAQESTPPDTDPRYDAIQPRDGESPLEIVRDFLAVGGSHPQRHAAARAYLTPKAAEDWKDNLGVAVLEDTPLYLEDRGGTEVVMSATQRARITVDGAYLPNPAPYPYDFRMEKIDGQWRIGNPPPGLLVTGQTFEQAWRPYNVYFLDSTRARVVPDVRMVPYPQDTALPSLLVGYLGSGPSDRLEGAVTSDLDGVRLQSNIVRDKDGVDVYLTGLGGNDDTLEPGGFAQLVWTLNQLGVGGIEVFLDGEQIAPQAQPKQTLQRFGDWRGFDPDALAVSTPGYFIRGGAVFTTTDGPVPGPVGTGAYAAQSVGVSLNRESLAVVGRRRGGSVGLWVGRAGGTPRLALTGTTMTTPTWGSAVDEVWTVRNGREIVLVQGNGQPSRVAAPALDGLGTVSALRLSRDGARVALVAGSAGRQQIYLGVVVREEGAVKIPALYAFSLGAGPVADVSWSDALTLTALVRPSVLGSSLYTVGIDGRAPGQLVNAARLPAPPAAVATAPNLPLLTVAARAVWRSPGSGEPWARVTQSAATESAPVYPG